MSKRSAAPPGSMGFERGEYFVAIELRDASQQLRSIGIVMLDPAKTGVSHGGFVSLEAARFVALFIGLI